jgi:hypothetical protein
MRRIETILSFVDVIGPLLGFLYCLWHSGAKVRGFYWLVGFLEVQVVCNGLAKVWIQLFPGNNIFLYKLNAVLSLLLVSAWLLRLLQPIVPTPRFRLYRLLAFAALIIAVFLAFMEDASGLNSLGMGLTGLCISFFCLLYYMQLIRNPGLPGYAAALPVTGSLFFYYSVCFFIFIAYKPLTQSLSVNAGMLWLFHNTILCIAALALAFFSKSRPKKTPWNPSSPSYS